MADFLIYSANIAATNAAVGITGTATNFLTDGIRPGDIAIMVEAAGPVSYPIDVVTSATALSFESVTPYRGTTGSGKTMVVMRRFENEAAADTFRRLNVLIQSLNDGTFIASNTNAAAAKTTLVNADIFPLGDSAASFGLKKVTAQNVAAYVSSVNAGAAEALTNKTNVIANHSSAVAFGVGFTPQIQSHGTVGSMGISRTAGASAGGPILGFLKSRDSAPGGYTIVANGDELGRLSFYGADGTNGIVGAQIRADVDGVPGTNDMPGRLVFLTTADGAAAATERMRIDNAGRVGIGITPATGTLLHVDGVIRYTSRPAAGTITAMGWDANGDLKASSSSLRYKNTIADYDKGLAEVLQLRPVTFKFNGEERLNAGFIAEEVDALGLSEVMHYDESGQPEGIMYSNMVAILTKALQEASAKIDALEERIAALENA